MERVKFNMGGKTEPHILVISVTSEDIGTIKIILGSVKGKSGENLARHLRETADEIESVLKTKHERGD